MLLIFYAFARELAPFKRGIKGRRSLGHRGLRGFRASVAGREICCIATGVGVERARESARLAFELFPDAELAIATGVAGALSGGLAAGDLVLADRILARWDDRPGFEHIHVIDAKHLDDLGRRLGRQQIKFATGAMLTSHKMLADGAQKRRAKEETGAIAVDMETAVLAKESVARSIPFVSMRAIIDALEEPVFEADLADRNGRVKALRLIGAVARHPSALIALPRLARNLARATSSLKTALDAILIESNGG